MLPTCLQSNYLVITIKSFLQDIKDEIFLKEILLTLTYCKLSEPVCAFKKEIQHANDKYSPVYALYLYVSTSASLYWTNFIIFQNENGFLLPF